MYKIKFVDLNGNKFTTNGVPFENMVLRDSRSLSDKTWQRFRGWSDDFTWKIADREVIEKLNPELDDQGYYKFDIYTWNVEKNPLMSEKRYLFGHLVYEKIYVYDTGRYEEKSAMYEIISDSGEVIFKYSGKKDDDDWKIVAELSGQKDRRTARISIAEKHGQMMPIAMSMLGVNIPNNIPKEEILPLIESDFLVSDRGGYIVRSFGKFAISKTNKTGGYYKITKELEKIRFISLIEEFKII